MLEKDIEKALCKRVKELGGLCEKFTSPGRRSVPDRLITLTSGKIVFVGVRNVGKQPTDARARDHERRRALGCDVRVINTMEDARAFTL